MTFEIRNLLVTGGAGFVGANFVQHWLRGHADGRVVVLDALTYAGNLANLESIEDRPEFRFVRGDIGDRALTERLLREERIDTIVHFAAESHVDRSIVASDAFVRTNVVGTHALLEAARRVWLEERSVERHRFHHVSTDEVYGSLPVGEAPFHEDCPYRPSSPYSASKAAADHLVRAYHRTYALDVTTSNSSNNYGPYHFPEKLIPLLIVNILCGQPLPIYGDGRNVRDWLHVSDHCRGIELVITRGRTGEVYNIGTGLEWENLRIALLLCEIADELFVQRPELRARFATCPPARGESAASLICFVPDRPGHDRRYAVDCSKIEQELGFSTTVSLQEGLRETFSWFADHKAWWRLALDEARESNGSKSPSVTNSAAQPTTSHIVRPR